ncbi:MAG: poly-gamma-glutamate biosynthesis protein PgsC/CapC, partial [Candidatus Hydrogenedentota bacterium]
MIVQSVGIGIIASLIFTEVVGLYAGGLIGPGYLALFLNQPSRIAMTIATAFIAYVFVSFLSQFTFIYGRRRFAAAVL